MNELRKFKVSSTLKDCVENVLKRWGIKYEIVNEDNSLFCKTSISGELFHKVVVRAKMEKETLECHSAIPFVTKEETEDMTVMQEIGNAYIIRDNS